MKDTIFVFTLVALFGLSATASAAGYKVEAVTNGGSVSGKVTFTGKDPAPQVYTISKNTDVCGKTQEIDFIKVNNGALTDVVVYLDKVKSGKPFKVAEGNVDQKKCRFEPFFSVMANKKNLVVKNSDSVAHNIHGYELMGSKKRTAFNVNQPDKDSVLKKKVKLRRGTAMKIECDQHDFMHGFVFVAKSPYYAVVGADGSFTIDNIPPGKYTIKSWHGTLGEQKTTVEVTAGGKASIDFAYK